MRDKQRARGFFTIALREIEGKNRTARIRRRITAAYERGKRSGGGGGKISVCNLVSRKTVGAEILWVCVSRDRRISSFYFSAGERFHLFGDSFIPLI